MADLLEFEWKRLVGGYKLERLDPDLLTFVHSSEDDFWFLVSVSDDAPSWVRELVDGDSMDGHIIKHNFEAYSYGNRYLVPTGRKLERYRPLEMYPALFMELADTDPTPEGATGFINKYGPPMVDHVFKTMPPADLWLVLEAAKAVKSIVRSWERYRETANCGWRAILEAAKAVKSIVRSWERYRETRNTQTFLRRLRSEPSLRHASFTIHLKQASEDDKLSMVLVPNDLLAAIWLQLAQAITKNYGFRQCDECLTWFEVAPGKGRPEKRFCSNACSMRAYRKRKVGVQ